MSNLVTNFEHTKKFGQKMRLARKRKGLTQVQLADMLDVHHSYIGRIEQGKQSPSIHFVLTISRILDVSIDVLMKDELGLDD